MRGACGRPAIKEDTVKTNVRIWLMGWAILLATVPGSTVFGDEEGSDDGIESSTSVDITFASNYTWRGQLLNEEPVMQPSLSASIWNFSFNAWANYDFTTGGGAANAWDFSEVDLTVAYGRDFGPVSFELGNVEYTFPGAAGPGTRELYVSAGIDILVSPTLMLAYDYGAIDGLYGNIGVSYGLPLDVIGIDLGANLGFAEGGYNKGYFGEDKFALNDLNVALGLAYDVVGPFSISAGANFSMLLDSDIADSAGDNDTSIYGYLGFGIAP